MEIKDNIDGLKSGRMKECQKCRTVKPIADFKNPRLITGQGRYCNECKGVWTRPSVDLSCPSSDSTVRSIGSNISPMQNGHKVCSSCGLLKNDTEFLDPYLPSGSGRMCKTCKSKSKSYKKRKVSLAKELITDSYALDGHKEVSASELIAAQRKVSCPKCGSKMRLRKGQYGKFYGCYKFPQCRGTRPI